MYRLERSHLFLHQAFRAAGPARPAIQNVLQTLRWDPLDDRLIALRFEPALEARAYSRGGRERHNDRLWPLRAGPALRLWAEHHGLAWHVQDDGALALDGCWLLELSSCSLATDGRDEAAIARYRAGGGRSLFAADDGFYWGSSYHLAVPGPIQVLPDSQGNLWHSEGGRYQRTLGPPDGITWIRRRQTWREWDDDDRRPVGPVRPTGGNPLRGPGRWAELRSGRGGAAPWRFGRSLPAWAT